MIVHIYEQTLEGTYTRCCNYSVEFDEPPGPLALMLHKHGLLGSGRYCKNCLKVANERRRRNEMPEVPG